MWLIWREWMRKNGYMTVEDIPALTDRVNCKVAFLKAPEGVLLEPKDEHAE